MHTWTTRDGRRIAYHRAGQGPGTILVHGGFIDGSSMTDLMRELAPSRTAFAPDRRGHGASSPYDGPHSFADDVTDLVGFSQYVVKELGDAVELVAHSAGCHIALAAAALAPVSRVVLWEPPDFNAKRVSPALWQKLETAAAGGKRKAVVRLLLNDVVGAHTGMHIPWFVFPVLFRTGFGKMLLGNALAGPTELRALEAHEWHVGDLAQMSVPVYPMVGSTSPPFNRQFADFIAAHVPGAGVEIVEGGHHGTPIDEPTRLAALLANLPWTS